MSVSRNLSSGIISLKKFGTMRRNRSGSTRRYATFTRSWSCIESDYIEHIFNTRVRVGAVDNTKGDGRLIGRIHDPGYCWS